MTYFDQLFYDKYGVSRNLEHLYISPGWGGWTNWLYQIWKVWTSNAEDSSWEKVIFGYHNNNNW